MNDSEKNGFWMSEEFENRLKELNLTNIDDFKHLVNKNLTVDVDEIQKRVCFTLEKELGNKLRRIEYSLLQTVEQKGEKIKENTMSKIEHFLHSLFTPNVNSTHINTTQSDSPTKNSNSKTEVQLTKHNK